MYTFSKLKLSSRFRKLYIQHSPEGGDGDGGDGDGGEGDGGDGEGGEGAAVVVVSSSPPFGSKHSHAEQYCVLTLSPQQSPPSQPHPSLLFSSSQ